MSILKQTLRCRRLLCFQQGAPKYPPIPGPLMTRVGMNREPPPPEDLSLCKKTPHSNGLLLQVLRGKELDCFCCCFHPSKDAEKRRSPSCHAKENELLPAVGSHAVSCAHTTGAEAGAMVCSGRWPATFEERTDRVQRPQ